MKKQVSFYHNDTYMGTVKVDNFTDRAVTDNRNRLAARLGVDPSAIVAKEQTPQYDADKAKRKGLA